MAEILYTAENISEKEKDMNRCGWKGGGIKEGGGISSRKEERMDGFFFPSAETWGGRSAAVLVGAHPPIFVMLLAFSPSTEYERRREDYVDSRRPIWWQQRPGWCQWDHRRLLVGFPSYPKVLVLLAMGVGPFQIVSSSYPPPHYTAAQLALQAERSLFRWQCSAIRSGPFSIDKLKYVSRKSRNDIE